MAIKAFGAGVGAGANYSFQPGGQPTDWVDVGIAGATGFLSTGAGFNATLAINVGGAFVGSGIKGENPIASIGGATAGTVVGYRLGKVIETKVDGIFNPWHRPDWVDIGLGISKPNPPSPIPGALGNVGSSFSQEPVGNAVKGWFSPSPQNHKSDQEEKIGSGK